MKQITFFLEGESPILMAKKFLNKNIFLCHISVNINWEVLTKSLVTFRRWDVAKYDDF